jgi:hypothetical protein
MYDPDFENDPEHGWDDPPGAHQYPEYPPCAEDSWDEDHSWDDDDDADDEEE